MKKSVTAGVAGLALVVAGVVACGGLTRANGSSDSQPAKEVWYHASDVALLATTGRPQLVEFFHPD